MFSRLKETLLNYRSYRLKVNEMSSIDQTDVDSLMAKRRSITKEQIAKEAASLISAGYDVLLDTSSTIALMAKYMDVKHATVITNSIDCRCILWSRKHSLCF